MPMKMTKQELSELVKDVLMYGYAELPWSFDAFRTDKLIMQEWYVAERNRFDLTLPIHLMSFDSYAYPDGFGFSMDMDECIDYFSDLWR